MVRGLAETARESAMAKERESTRTARKKQLLVGAMVLLDEALNSCPVHLVGRRGSKDRHRTKDMLAPRLRIALAERVTGDEDLVRMCELIQEFLADWCAEQEQHGSPWLKRLGSAAKRGATALAGTTVLVLATPQGHAILQKGADALGRWIAGRVAKPPTMDKKDPAS
jgi:hypothetical protein